MTTAGPICAGALRARPPRALPRRVRPTALVPLLLGGLLAGCSLAGPSGSPAPEEGTGADADETPYLDGSLDGAGDPAGLEELVLGTPADGADAWSGTDRGEGGGGAAGGGSAGAGGPASGSVADAPLGEALPLDEAIRLQFGSLFLDPTAPVPPEVTARVAEYVELFHRGRARENYERWLAREGRYRELILSELRAAGLPEGLLYLAMLESGFNPVAVSRAKAVGLWQFMRTTGRESGLRIDDWVDERRDPIAATRAAIGHLKVLHRELGDWALAAAAYNAGLGRVRRAQRGTGAGYFQLVSEGRLPRETRNYVPLILAAGHVARNRDRYGLGHITPEPPHAFDTVRVDGRTRLSAVARAVGLPVAELNALNGHLVRGAAPPGQGYALRVPVGTTVADLPTRLAALPLEERILPEYREVFVTVKAGDSWWKIANARGKTVRSVRALNPKARDVIHPGQRILVERELVTDAQLASSPPTRAASGPASARSGPASAGSGPSTTAREERTRVASRDGHYRVRPGDTMSELAADLGISLADLARWNGMPAPRPLRAGERLRVVPPPPVRHRVAPCETMTGLARRYGVTLDQLVAWNGMRTARPLRTGETLVVAEEGRAGTASAVVANPPPAEVEPVRHRVVRGETLTSVARRYDVSIADLVRWNQLGRARPLREGETLVVQPGAGADGK